MAMVIDSLDDLETRGFVLVRGFLGPDEMQMLRDDFAGVSVGDNRNYKSKSPTAAVNATIQPRIEEVLRQVNAQTSLHVDTHVPNTSAYFGTDAAEGVSFPWHQDHESYFVVQNHFDYLNFYIPFIKPDTTKSNLCVVPFDTLRQQAPRAHKFLVRRGAGSFRSVCGRWLATNDDQGGSRVIKPDLDAMSHTPQLAEGDLLLLRGDIIHRTQDHDTDRVALSWRAANGDSIVRRARLASGGVRKAVIMRNNPSLYQRAFRAFDAAGRDALPLREFIELYESLPAPAAVDRHTFMKQLMHEKRRSHVLRRYVANAPVAVGFKGLDTVQRALHHR